MRVICAKMYFLIWTSVGKNQNHAQICFKHSTVLFHLFKKDNNKIKINKLRKKGLFFFRHSRILVHFVCKFYRLVVWRTRHVDPCELFLHGFRARIKLCFHLNMFEPMFFFLTQKTLTLYFSQTVCVCVRRYFIPIFVTICIICYKYKYVHNN